MSKPAGSLRMEALRRQRLDEVYALIEDMIRQRGRLSLDEQLRTWALTFGMAVAFAADSPPKRLAALERAKGRMDKACDRAVVFAEGRRL